MCGTEVPVAAAAAAAATVTAATVGARAIVQDPFPTQLRTAAEVEFDCLRAKSYDDFQTELRWRRKERSPEVMEEERLIEQEVETYRREIALMQREAPIPPKRVGPVTYGGGRAHAVHFTFAGPRAYHVRKVVKAILLAQGYHVTSSDVTGGNTAIRAVPHPRIVEAIWEQINVDWKKMGKPAPDWLVEELDHMDEQSVTCMMQDARRHAQSQSQTPTTRYFQGTEAQVFAQILAFLQDKYPRACDEATGHFRMLATLLSQKRPAPFFTRLEKAKEEVDVDGGGKADMEMEGSLNEHHIEFLLQDMGIRLSNQQLSNDQGY